MTSDYQPWHQPTAHWRSVLKNHEILRSLLQSEMWWDKTCCSKFVSCLSVSLWTPSKGLSLEWGPLSVNRFNRSSQIWLLPFVITTNILHWSHRSTELYRYKRYATSELRTQSQPPDPVMSCWLCTQCTPSKKAVLQCRGASTVGFSKALAPKHPTGSWKGKIPHTSPVVYQYSKNVKRYWLFKSHWFWFFDSLIVWLQRISFNFTIWILLVQQLHQRHSEELATTEGEDGTERTWGPFIFHCMTCMIACNSSKTAVKTACRIEARIKELILFSRCKLQKCYITLQFSPCTLVRPQKLQRPSAALSSPCA